MTLAELGERLSSEDVEEWVAFHTMEAEDERRAYEAARLGPSPADDDESLGGR